VEGGNALVTSKWSDIKRKKGVKEEIPAKEELKNCPRCGRKMSWFESDDGTIAQWCYWEQAAFLDPNLKL